MLRLFRYLGKQLFSWAFVPGKEEFIFMAVQRMNVCNSPSPETTQISFDGRMVGYTYEAGSIPWKQLSNKELTTDTHNGLNEPQGNYAG